MIFINILFLIYVLLVITPIYIILNKKTVSEIDNIIKIAIAILLVPISIFFMICFNYLILGIFNIDYLGSINNNILKKLICILIGLPALVIILLNIFLQITKDKSIDTSSIASNIMRQSVSST
jgi:hypothetical protein